MNNYIIKMKRGALIQALLLLSLNTNSLGQIFQGTLSHVVTRKNGEIWYSDDHHFSAWISGKGWRLRLGPGSRYKKDKSRYVDYVEIGSDHTNIYQIRHWDPERYNLVKGATTNTAFGKGIVTTGPFPVFEPTYLALAPIWLGLIAPHQAATHVDSNPAPSLWMSPLVREFSKKMDATERWQWKRNPDGSLKQLGIRTNGKLVPQPRPGISSTEALSTVELAGRFSQGYTNLLLSVSDRTNFNDQSFPLEWRVHRMQIDSDKIATNTTFKIAIDSVSQITNQDDSVRVKIDQFSVIEDYRKVHLGKAALRVFRRNGWAEAPTGYYQPIKATLPKAPKLKLIPMILIGISLAALMAIFRLARTNQENNS